MPRSRRSSLKAMRLALWPNPFTPAASRSAPTRQTSSRCFRNLWRPSRRGNPCSRAGFVYNGGFARVDILNPVGGGTWDIIEVKSSTEVKDVNLIDLAFQAFVYNGAGLNIRRCFVMCVDREYVRHGAVDPKKFFKVVDVTKDVTGLSRGIRPKLDDMFATIGHKQEPEIKIGPHCSDPYTCPLTDKCWSFLPADSVFDLYYGGKKCWRLFQEGVVNLKDIPDDVELTDRLVQVARAPSGAPPPALRGSERAGIRGSPVRLP